MKISEIEIDEFSERFNKRYSIFSSPTYEDGKLVSIDFWTNFFFTYQNPLGIQITQLWQWYLYLFILMLLATLLLYLFYLPIIRRNNKTK